VYVTSLVQFGTDGITRVDIRVEIPLQFNATIVTRLIPPITQIRGDTPISQAIDTAETLLIRDGEQT